MAKDNVPNRAPNFTAKEIETLIYHLELKPELLKPAARVNRDGVKMIKSSITLTVKDKLKLWEEIAAEINKIGESSLTGVVRSGLDVKGKWFDLKSRVKVKAESIRSGKLSNKTSFSQLEERVLYLIAKTSNLQGSDVALPPAYSNMIGRKKKNKTANSNSEQDEIEVAIESIADLETKINETYTDEVETRSDAVETHSEEVETHSDEVETHSDDIETHSAEVETHSDDIETNSNDVIPIEPKVPEIKHIVLPLSSTMPVAPRIITLTTPLRQILKAKTKARVNNCSNADSNPKESLKRDHNDSEECDTRGMMEMIYSTQRELKTEIKSIKKIMIRTYEQKRKRIEQENEKIQLKKMKLMLECRKQGLDYDEFITDFM